MSFTDRLFRSRREDRRRAEESAARVTELEAALAAAKSEASRALSGLRAELEKRHEESLAHAIEEAIGTRDNRIRELEAAFAVRDADVDSLLVTHQTQRARIAELEAEIRRRDESVGDLRTRLEKARDRIREVQEAGGPDAREDDLTTIRGIGRVLGTRLREAGIDTFRRLADTPPEDLLKIAKLPAWSIANPDAWIEQARQLAAARPAPAQ